MESEDPVIQNSRKLPFLALKWAASEHLCNYFLEISAYAMCKVLLRETEVIQGRIYISMGIRWCFLFAYFFCVIFVIKIHGFYTTTQIKLSKRCLIPGIAQQHHQLIKVVFSFQIKMLKWKWPHLGICAGAACPIKVDRNLTSATEEV